MTTWAGLQPILRAPVMGFAYAISWDGFEFDPETLRTGDPANPAQWLEWHSEMAASEYGTYTGGDQRRVFGAIYCRLMVEPIAGDKPLWDMIGALETAYAGQDTTQITFHLDQAWPSDISFLDGVWLRRDWRCPFLWFKEAT